MVLVLCLPFAASLFPCGLGSAWVLLVLLAVLFPPATGGVPEGISQWHGWD